MRVLVIGAGALGGYYGACLVRAGRDVTFLVRPGRAVQLRRNGLQVVSPHGDFAVQPKIVLANDLKETFDVVLVGVKSYSLDDAMAQFAPAVGANTMILPILNGLKHIDALTARFGAACVLGGLANVSAGLDADGRVVQFMANQMIVLGETKGSLSERVLALETLLQVPGLDVRASEAIMQDMWEKFVQLSTLAGITCLMRASIGDILAVPNGEQSIFRLFAECGVGF
ncbi:2-dehydropantoate 2-reductase [Bradyrhizobium japonicum]